MVASMCVFNAFWISFQPSWADLEQAALANRHRTIDTMHANSKRFIHTLLTDMIFD